MQIAFAGLGNMGLAMARLLLQAGHRLTVYNRTRSRADQLKDLKPVVAETPAAAARGADVLITMLADDDSLEAVMLGPEGAVAALPAARQRHQARGQLPARRGHRSDGRGVRARPQVRHRAGGPPGHRERPAHSLTDLRELREADRRRAL